MTEHLETLERIYGLPKSHKDLNIVDRLIAVMIKQQIIIDKLGERLDRIADTFPGSRV